VRRLQKARAIQQELAAMRIQKAFRSRLFRDTLALIAAVRSRCVQLGQSLHEMDNQAMEVILLECYTSVRGEKSRGRGRKKSSVVSAQVEGFPAQEKDDDDDDDDDDDVTEDESMILRLARARLNVIRFGRNWLAPGKKSAR
jgi:hypothetical protein